MKSSKKKSKKKKPSPAATATAGPAPTPPRAADSSSGASCSSRSETLTLAAAAAASETESSGGSGGEAAAYTSAFTSCSSGGASTSSSAFSSSASSASSSATGDERRDLAWLLDAFGSATIDQVDSAYRGAGDDSFLAAGILGSTQDPQPNSSYAPLGQVSIEEGEAKAKDLGVMFIETSAKADFNIKPYHSMCLEVGIKWY